MGYLMGVHRQSGSAVLNLVPAGGTRHGSSIGNGREKDDNGAGGRNRNVQGDGVGIVGAHLLDFWVDGLEGVEFRVSWGFEIVKVVGVHWVWELKM